MSSRCLLLPPSLPSRARQTRDFVGKLPMLKEAMCFDVDFDTKMRVVDKHQFIPSEPVEPDDLATLTYTSGTTGGSACQAWTKMFGTGLQSISTGAAGSWAW
jgi:hypothetical protein